MHLATDEVYECAHLHLPPDAAEAVVAVWRSNWGGAVIYITTRSAKLPAFLRWREDTLAALESAGYGEREMQILLRNLGGNFARF